MSTTYAIQSKHRKHFLPFFFEVAVYTLENLSSQVYLSDAFFSRKRLVIQKEKSLHKMLSPVFLFPPAIFMTVMVNIYLLYVCCLPLLLRTISELLSEQHRIFLHKSFMIIFIHLLLSGA